MTMNTKVDAYVVQARQWREVIEQQRLFVIQELRVDLLRLGNRRREILKVRNS